MLQRESVLKDKEMQNYNGIDFKELLNVPKINLRGQSSNKYFMKSVNTILNVLLPTESNTSNTNNDTKVMWLSPNEWLIQTLNENMFKEIFKNLQSTLNPENTAVTDITENRTILKISGHNVYILLAKFMVINLDQTLNKDNAVAQSLFLKVPVLLVRNNKDNEKPSIDIHINRSHANYIFNLLVDGTRNLDF
jgi:sarcosine oxidase subunit gamma